MLPQCINMWVNLIIFCCTVQLLCTAVDLMVKCDSTLPSCGDTEQHVLVLQYRLCQENMFRYYKVKWFTDLNLQCDCLQNELAVDTSHPLLCITKSSHVELLNDMGLMRRHTNETSGQYGWPQDKTHRYYYGWLYRSLSWIHHPHPHTHTLRPKSILCVLWKGLIYSATIISMTLDIYLLP